MKKITILLVALGMLFSCATDDTLSNLNKDPKNPTEGVPDELFFSNAQKALYDTMESISININIFRFLPQYITPTTYTSESLYNFQSRTIPGNFWGILYRDVLTDFKAARQELNREGNYSTSKEIAIRDNRLAMVTLLEVYTYSVLVDTFGNIPYSEALDGNNLTPAYDDAMAIYQDLFTKIDTSLSLLDTSAEGYGAADVMYNGNVEQWIKFGNSLKLRMAIRLVDIDPSQAQSLVEEAAPHVFSSNDDNATFAYMSAPPNTNTLWLSLVQSGRNDYVVSSTIVDMMNDLEDPRRDIFFSNPMDGEYVGGPYGAGADFETTSQYGNLFLEPDLPGNILDYSEVKFFLAEAAARGYDVGGTPEAHYNEAIRASFEYWGLSDAEATAYLANPDVAYTTATGNFEQKIGTQLWIALFNRGFEGWSHWRRLDFPMMNPAPQLTLDDIPVRLTYPIDEQNRNNANRESAANAIGGDRLTTKLFWDVD